MTDQRDDGAHRPTFTVEMYDGTRVQVHPSRELLDDIARTIAQHYLSTGADEMIRAAREGEDAT